MPRIDYNLARVYIDGSGYHNVVTLDSSKPAGRRLRKLKISSPTTNYPYWRNLLSNNATLDLYVCDLDNPSTNIKIGSTTVAAGTNGTGLINTDITITDTDNKLTGKALGFFFYFYSWSYTNPTDMANMMLFAGSSIPLIDFTLTTDTLNHTVTWNLNGGTGGGTTSAVVHGGTPSHVNPTKEQDTEYTYAFAGWQKNNNDVVLANERITADTTYTARYTSTKRSYTIAANINPAGAGTLSVPTSAVWGDTVNLAQTPAADYEFVKWQLNGEDLQGDSFTMPKNNVTVTAVYREAHKTVKYYTNGAFVECVPYYYDGESFVEVEPRYWDGTQWVLCSQT